MTTPFQDALLAIEIAVEAMHDLRHESPAARALVDDAFAQMKHLGFDVDVPAKKPATSHAAQVVERRTPSIRAKRLTQRTLF